jgi:hypothetical protein
MDDYTITIVDAEVREVATNIPMADGSRITEGVGVRITLRYGERVAVDESAPIAVTREQPKHWCQEYCQQTIAKLPRSMTPGEAVRDHGIHYETLANLGIPTPPQRRFVGERAMLEYHARTGRPGIYIENELYREHARQVNAWIAAHPNLAADYGVQVMDANYQPLR